MSEELKQLIAIIGAAMAVGINILLVGMAWGSIRTQLKHMVDALKKMSSLLEKHDDKIDALDRSQVRTKEQVGSAFRQIDDLKKQASG